jgi:hypothetical protein
MPLPNDARNVCGTIERSINVDSLQQHHELGCSVTNECGVSHSAAPTDGRDGCVRITSCSASISHYYRGNSAGDRDQEAYYVHARACLRLSAGHGLLDRRQRRVSLGLAANSRALDTLKSASPSSHHTFVRLSPCFRAPWPRYRLNDATKEDDRCDYLSR